MTDYDDAPDVSELTVEQLVQEVKTFGWDDRNVNLRAEDALDELERRASA